MRVSIPRPTAIASTLLWFAGAFIFLMALAVSISATSSKSPAAAGSVLIGMLLWALAYGIGGFALRKQGWGFRWWCIGLCISSLLGAVLLLTPMMLIILALNIVALVLVVLDWRKAGNG